MDKKNKVSIEKQEDGSYIAYNTNMSGCTIIGTGDSVAAAKKDFLESMAGVAEAKRELGDEVPEAFSNVPDYKFDKIMEYTEMIDKVKALAVQNRAAQTEEEKDEVRRQMNILKSIDPKAFTVAVGYMAKHTEQKVKELTMAEKLGEITDMVSMAYIAKAYFGKSRSWLAHKMNGNIVNGKTSQFSPDELAILRTALQDMSKKFGALSLTI